jgi:hypothetical protein
MSTAVRTTSTAGTLATDDTQVTPRAAITIFHGRVDSNSRDNCNITTDASNRRDLSSSIGTPATAALQAKFPIRRP